MRGPPGRSTLSGLFLRVALSEALDPTLCVDEALLTGVKRMREATNIHAHYRVLDSINGTFFRLQ